MGQKEIERNPRNELQEDTEERGITLALVSPALAMPDVDCANELKDPYCCNPGP